MTIDELIYKIEMKQMKEGVDNLVITECFKKFGKRMYYLKDLNLTLEGDTLFCHDTENKIFEQDYVLSSILMTNVVDIIGYSWGYELILTSGTISIELIQTIK